FLRQLRAAVDKVPRRGPRPAVGDAKLTEVVLENIGAFEKLMIKVNEKWTVLLGGNGCGKSTLLRAIALGLTGDVEDSQAASRLLRNSAETGAIELCVGTVRYRTELVREMDSGRVHVRSLQLTPLQAGQWVVLGFPPLRGVAARALTGAKQVGGPR